MAMTWIWRHVIQAIEPAICGFIDHDLIPFEPVDLRKLLDGQPFYGVRNTGDFGWSLWAGFCLYNFTAVRGLPLNFLNDFSRLLDTGGRNWRPLYSRYDDRKIRFAPWELFDVVNGTPGEPRQIETVDNRWVHIGRVSYTDSFRAQSDFYDRVVNLIKGNPCGTFTLQKVPARRWGRHDPRPDTSAPQAQTGQ
jgi:hypothetical protein